MKPIAELEYFDRKYVDNQGRTRNSPAFIVIGPDGSRSIPLNNNQVRAYLKDKGWQKAESVTA
jgi:hypothetical protein